MVRERRRVGAAGVLPVRARAVGVARAGVLRVYLQVLRPVPDAVRPAANVRIPERLRAVYQIYFARVRMHRELVDAEVVEALAQLDVVAMGRFGSKYAEKTVEWVYCNVCWYPPDYDSDESTMYESESSGMPSSVRLANLKKISSSVLLGDWFQHPYGRRKGDWEEKKQEYDGRWWTPRGQNPWAWAFGTR